MGEAETMVEQQEEFKDLKSGCLTTRETSSDNKINFDLN